MLKMKPWLFNTICLIMTIFLITNNALEIPEHLRKHARRIHKRCQNQSDTPEAVIKESLKGGLPNNKNFECYIQCLFDIMGIMDESNTIHIDNLLQILPEEMHPMVTMLSQACGTKDGDGKCNIAFNTMQCYVENNPTIIKDQFEFLFGN
uniref:Odorant-binding protein 8 n=2 Tax=Delia TaxID=30063 RepID=A0A0N7KC02_9MUSC|nr:odorant binding protein 8 [Delia antiqua]BAS69447.1 odorant-binding protein 8 [Delia platura]